ncbi:hypothetical protein [Aminobacter sp. SR38]|uniref:hypothetical protein n=1 Tax=Aminobacter sp. SR38 TaxID=2774562 RepID=UPI001FEE7162|nr:hypothetical protein [Aminobacter sp. SR38]
MKKNNGYMNRALQSSDPRFARILGKLGYGRRDMQATPIQSAPTFDDIARVREEYAEIVGRQPFMGWDIDTLREKIAAAKAKG